MKEQLEATAEIMGYTSGGDVVHVTVAILANSEAGRAIRDAQANGKLDQLFAKLTVSEAEIA